MTTARVIGTPYYFNCLDCEIELLDEHARLTGRCIEHAAQTQGFPISQRAEEVQHEPEVVIRGHLHNRGYTPAMLRAMEKARGAKRAEPQ